MKQKLLLLHGALGSAAMFKTLASVLKNDFDILTFNFSGHGGKPFPKKDFSISLFANELEDFILQEQLAPANIFGYSMGGYVALWLSKNKPNLICSVCTLGTKLSWNPETAAKELRMLDADKIESKIPSFANELKKRHQPNDWKKVVEQTAILIKNLGTDYLSEDDIISLSTKVLFTIGDNDTMVSIEETHHTHTLLKMSSFKILANTFHPLEKLNTQMMSEVLKQFFLA